MSRASLTSPPVRPAPGTAALACVLALTLLLSAPATAQEDEPDPSAPFVPLIGEWMIDPESELVRSAPPERREELLSIVGLAFAWGDTAQSTVEIREIYPIDEPKQARGYGIAVWNPVDQLHHFMAANTEQDFYFEGYLQVLEDGAVQRVYEVFYGADRSQIPGENEPGWTRRFRDTYRVDGDAMEQRVEIFWNGGWRPFSGGAFTLIRREA